MHRQYVLAVSISLLLLLPGCASFSEKEVESIAELDCATDPNSDGCFENLVTADDCSQTQVFTGESCRTMMRPEVLDFGESAIALEAGKEIQKLTPSFLGDAPSSWAVNPSFPDGLSIDPDSGVISGTPSHESPPKSFTIIHSSYSLTFCDNQIVKMYKVIQSEQFQSFSDTCMKLVKEMR